MPKLIPIVFASLLTAAMVGCSRAKPVGLSIEGYNYTNRFIVDLTVTDENGNSAWGGDVLLSTPTSGGGRSSCCVMLDSTNKKPVRLRIDWTFDCVDDESGHTIAPAIKKSTWVTVSPPYPQGAHNFEVHFYAGGRVAAAITHWPSPLRISLLEDRRPIP